ncbi:TPA: hypothetical protein ACXRYW_005351 [Klebsiella variicola subsp. variicola]
MNLEEHFEDQTSEILINGRTPLTNSLPFEYFYLGEHITKAFKRYKKTHPCDYFMTVTFERKQPLKDGQIVKWTLKDDEYDVIIIKSTELYVKGRKVYAYSLGIKK